MPEKAYAKPRRPKLPMGCRSNRRLESGRRPVEVTVPSAFSCAITWNSSRRSASGGSHARVGGGVWIRPGVRTSMWGAHFLGGGGVPRTTGVPLARGWGPAAGRGGPRVAAEPQRGGPASVGSLSTSTTSSQHYWQRRRHRPTAGPYSSIPHGESD